MRRSRGLALGRLAPSLLLTWLLPSSSLLLLLSLLSLLSLRAAVTTELYWLPRWWASHLAVLPASHPLLSFSSSVLLCLVSVARVCVCVRCVVRAVLHGVSDARAAAPLPPLAAAGLLLP